MADHVIVGAGASGLYTAYRLLKHGGLVSGDTVQVYEWSQRPGGRIHTFTFPDDVGGDGLYCEFGGMRFATDPGFPSATTEGHRLVQNLILELGLDPLVVPFGKSSDRLYYLRGQHVYETDLTDVDALPYGFNDEFRAFLAKNNVTAPYTADTIIGAIATVFAPKLGGANGDRPAWCSYFAHGEVPADGATASYPAGSPVRDIGYWNLLYDQLGDEGYDYAADGNGYTSNVINWNAADALENNNDVGSTTSYMRLDGGYSLLFETLAAQITELAKAYPGSGIFYGRQLTALSDSADRRLDHLHVRDARRRLVGHRDRPRRPTLPRDAAPVAGAGRDRLPSLLHAQRREGEVLPGVVDRPALGQGGARLRRGVVDERDASARIRRGWSGLEPTPRHRRRSRSAGPRSPTCRCAWSTTSRTTSRADPAPQRWTVRAAGQL